MGAARKGSGRCVFLVVGCQIRRVVRLAAFGQQGHTGVDIRGEEIPAPRSCVGAYKREEGRPRFVLEWRRVQDLQEF